MINKQNKIKDIKEERLNKLISECGYCSRRKADDLILNGKVTVNGEIIKQLGTKTPVDAEIFIEGKRLLPKDKVYLVINKPKDCISTVKDPENRKTVLDFLDIRFKEIVFPVGRLDRNTTGVLLLTNDGDLTFRLTHPSHKIKKVYHATLDKSLHKNDAIRLIEGIIIDQENLSFDSVEFIDFQDKRKVEVVIHSGKYHFIKIMFEQLGYKVMYLDRVSFAGIVKKSLKRGEWRHLNQQEIKMLKNV